MTKIERQFDKFVGTLPHLIESLTDKAAAALHKSLKRKWPGQARYEHRVATGFQGRLKKRWKPALGLLSMLISVGAEFGASRNDELRANPGTNPLRIEVLTRLHARACQIGSEIVTLLSDGFADGALARWRTLHDISVVAHFIAAGDEDLAERYIFHQVCENRRSVDEYMSFRRRLGLPPIPALERRRIREEYAALLRRYGEEYASPYGWAAAALKKPAPTFSDLERATEIDHLRPYYRLATHGVHANPKGIYFKIGLRDETQLLLAGPSNFGLADPGQNAALTFLQINSALATIDGSFESAVVVKVMERLADDTIAAFARIQAKMAAT